MKILRLEFFHCQLFPFHVHESQFYEWKFIFSLHFIPNLAPKLNNNCIMILKAGTERSFLPQQKHFNVMYNSNTSTYVLHTCKLTWAQARTEDISNHLHLNIWVDWYDTWDWREVCFHMLTFKSLSVE